MQSAFTSTPHDYTQQTSTLCTLLGSVPGPSCRPDSDPGLQCIKGEDSGSKNQNPQGVRNEEPPKGETNLGTPEQVGRDSHYPRQRAVFSTFSF